MSEARLAGLFARLPEGLSEIYLHPATADQFAGSAALIAIARNSRR